MKKIILTLLLAAMSSGASAQSDDFKLTSKQSEAQRYFQSGKEPKVKDALWTSQKIFKVGVLDDKKPRDGYANYVCEVLHDYGFKGLGIWVQVVDIARLKQTGKWVKLGEAHCL